MLYFHIIGVKARGWVTQGFCVGYSPGRFDQQEMNVLRGTDGHCKARQRFHSIRLNKDVFSEHVSRLYLGLETEHCDDDTHQCCYSHSQEHSLRLVVTRTTNEGDVLNALRC